MKVRQHCSGLGFLEHEVGMYDVDEHASWNLTSPETCHFVRPVHGPGSRFVTAYVPCQTHVALAFRAWQIQH